MNYYYYDYNVFYYQSTSIRIIVASQIQYNIPIDIGIIGEISDDDKRVSSRYEIRSRG